MSRTSQDDHIEAEEEEEGYLECRGQCPGACGMDGSFYMPRDRFQDKKRDQPSFTKFARKIPPIGRKYKFDGDEIIISDGGAGCRGPDHVTNGPCYCCKEMATRPGAKKRHIEPFGFIKGAVPEDAFPPGWPIKIGEAVDLLSEDNGIYEVQLHDGSQRFGHVDASLLQIIEDVHSPKCSACHPTAPQGTAGEGGAEAANADVATKESADLRSVSNSDNASQIFAEASLEEEF